MSSNNIKESFYEINSKNLNEMKCDCHEKAETSLGKHRKLTWDIEFCKCKILYCIEYTNMKCHHFKDEEANVDWNNTNKNT